MIELETFRTFMMLFQEGVFGMPEKWYMVIVYPYYLHTERRVHETHCQWCSIECDKTWSDWTVAVWQARTGWRIENSDCGTFKESEWVIWTTRNWLKKKLKCGNCFFLNWIFRQCWYNFLIWIVTVYLMKNRSSGSDEGKQITDIPNFYDILVP